MSISYAPGTAFALVRPGVVVLLDDAVEPTAVSAIWSALETLGRPDGMADVLDSLTTVLDPSLRELPDFGVVVHESGPEGEETGVLHVVARGRVSVHLAGEVGSETIEAFGMTTWADKRFTDVDRYELAVGETGLEAALTLALTTGVVTARSVSWQRPHEAGATAGASATDVASVGTADDTIDEDGLAAVAAVAAVGGSGADDEVREGGELREDARAADAEGEDQVSGLDPAMVPVHPAEPDFARTLGEFPEAPTDELAGDDPAGDEPVTGDSVTGDSATGDASAEDAPPEGLADEIQQVEGTPAHEAAPQADDVQDSAAPAVVLSGAQTDDEAVSAGAAVSTDEAESDDDLEDTVFSLEGVRGVLAARAAAVAETGPDHVEPVDPGLDESGRDDVAVGAAQVDETGSAQTETGGFDEARFRKTGPGEAAHDAAGRDESAGGSAVTPSVPAPTTGLPPVPPPPPEPAPAAPLPAAASWPAPSVADQHPDQPAPAGHAPYPVYQAAPQMPPGEALPAGTGPVPTSDRAPEQAGWAAPSPAAPPAPAAPLYPQGSGPQWTVQLPGTPPAADEVAPAAAPSQVPTILARSCAYGHANTPVRSTCAVCGGGLNPQAEVVPRPSLGRVVLSTGDVVELEQPLVLGRYPQAHVVTAQAQAPRLVTVPSPSQDISRSHLEVRLEGWNVLLVDLTTVNGTTLLRPGQPPRRLHPQEPTLVMSGDVADLGDGVRLTFEGLA